MIRRDLALLAAGSLLLFGVALGAHDLWNPNEPIYGEAVKEMLARGSWSVPYVNGIPFGEKPILYYWLALAASKLAGDVTETTLRAPAVLAGISIVVGAYLLVLPYAGRRRALYTALATLTTYEVWWVARTIQMDVLVASATLWTILPATRVLDFGRAPWKGWGLAGIVAGLGFLAKGPVAWICPGLVLVAYAVFTRRIRELFTPPVLVAAVAALAIAATWPTALAAAGHADVVHEVLIRQNFQRFTNPWDHVAPFWYYGPYLFLDMAPYAGFALIAWRLPREDERQRRLALLAFCWIAAIVLFFSMSKSKRDPYIVPVAPAVAILAAEVAIAFRDRRLSRARDRAVVGVASVVGAILLVGAGVVAVRLAPRHPELAGTARLIVAALAGAGMAIGVAALHRRRHALLPATLAAGTAALYLVIAVFVLPALDTFKSARPVASSIAALAGPADRIVSYNFWRWRAEYRFYLDRPIENVWGPQALEAAWSSSDRVVLLVDRTSLDSARRAIGDAAPALSRPVGSQTIYVFTNR